MLFKIVPIIVSLAISSLALGGTLTRKSAEAAYVVSVFKSMISSSCLKFPQHSLCSSNPLNEILIVTHEYSLKAGSVVPECGLLKPVYGHSFGISLDDQVLSYDELGSQITGTRLTWGKTSFDWGHAGKNFNFCMSESGEVYKNIHHFIQDQKLSKIELKVNLGLSTFSNDLALGLVQQFGFEYSKASLVARYLETWMTKVSVKNSLTTAEELEKVYSEVVGVSFRELLGATKSAQVGEFEEWDQVVHQVVKKHKTTPENASKYLMFVLKSAYL